MSTTQNAKTKQIAYRETEKNWALIKKMFEEFRKIPGHEAANLTTAMRYYHGQTLEYFTEILRDQSKKNNDANS